MSTISRFSCVLIGALVLLATSLADARRGSVLINQKPIRQRLSALVKGDSLRLGKRLVGPTRGISSLALRKARQTARGFDGFNYRSDAKSFVLGGKGRKLVVTTARVHHYLAGVDGPMSHFVARDAKSGIVVGRGFVKQGQITWTRSKNERGRNTPSERNAAR